VIHPLDVILHKRDGLVLSDAEVQAFVRAVVERTAEKQLVTDAQIASFLMAVFQRGLNTAELAALTGAMRYSGETFDSAPLGAYAIDKHSTGGVGDKTSLLIAPILAAAGRARGLPQICVPMISGRSLGHTGGTLDKLETIPGFDTQLTMARFEQVLRQCGACMIGQTPRLVPADRILYGLRDHTGTVESPYLITASIMSKKLAEGLNGLVLDVKTGSGAFMRRFEDAEFLARLMVETGEASGTRTVALLTRMDEPLGRYAGNYVEVMECVDLLKGERHALSADLIELTNVLAGWMLHLAGHADTPAEGALLSDEIMKCGAAFEAFLEMVSAQGGDASIFRGEADPHTFHKPVAQRVLLAEAGGYLAGMDCTEVGWAVQRLGAGRLKPGDPVSAHAGIEVHAKLGDRVEQGQTLVTLFSEDEALLAEPYEMLRATYRIAAQKPALGAMVREVIRAPDGTADPLRG
jgi:pyrimidine-nucleoside phosphorylase